MLVVFLILVKLILFSFTAKTDRSSLVVLSQVKNLAIWRTSGRSEVSPWVRQSLADSNSRYNLSRVSENFVVVVKRALSHSHTEVALRIGSKSCCRSHHYTPFASVHWMFSIDIGNEILSDLSHASVALYAP